MIQFATLHKTGSTRRWDRTIRAHTTNPNKYTLKYFDPADPLESLTSEFIESKTKPDIHPETCLVEIEDAQLYEWAVRNATSNMWASCETFILANTDEIAPFVDMWGDAGFYEVQVFGKPLDHRKLLLFLFWKQRGIGFNRRLFLECFPPFKPRRSYRDET